MLFEIYYHDIWYWLYHYMLQRTMLVIAFFKCPCWNGMGSTCSVFGSCSRYYLCNHYNQCSECLLEINLTEWSASLVCLCLSVLWSQDFWSHVSMCCIYLRFLSTREKDHFRSLWLWPLTMKQSPSFDYLLSCLPPATPWRFDRAVSPSYLHPDTPWIHPRSVQLSTPVSVGEVAINYEPEKLCTSLV